MDITIEINGNAVVDTKGLVSLRGDWDASINSMPTSGGRGDLGVPNKGDQWRFWPKGGIVQDGDGNDQLYPAGTLAIAVIDSPGQNGANWILK